MIFSRMVIIVITFVQIIAGEAAAQKIFIEDSSLVIVEIESAGQMNGWTVGGTITDGTAVRYLHWKGENYFTLPGKHILEYKIKMTNPGTYRFLWHSKVGKGDSKTEHNDTWLRIPDASEFYGDKNGHIVRPKGICTDDCPKGAGADGWFKIYSSGTTDWTWSTRTSDKDAHLIYVRFDTAGIYTVQISARSSGHWLNRFVLYVESHYSHDEATSLSKSESNSYHWKKQ